MGGRTEAFHLGEIEGGPFVSLDINSMYPHVMKSLPVPVKLVEYTDTETLDHAMAFIKMNSAIAEVEVETDEPCYAVRMNGRICFPVGSFTAFVCTHGLRYGFERGHIKKINRIAWYEDDTVFSAYVDFFYTLRKRYESEGNAIFALMCKYLLNSLYGKFGQKKPITDERIEEVKNGYERYETYDFVTGNRYVEYLLMNKRITEVDKTEGNHSFTAIAAHITEAARFLLWEIIKKAGPENVLYCDTDCVKIREKDMDALEGFMDQERLGCLKVDAQFERLTINGPKDYKTENVTRIKGIPTGALKVGPYSWRYTQFLGQYEHMRKRAIDYVITREVTKVTRNEYRKGVVIPGGKILPFRLSLLSTPP